MQQLFEPKPSHMEVERRRQDLERQKKELADDRARHAEALEIGGVHGRAPG